MAADKPGNPVLSERSTRPVLVGQMLCYHSDLGVIYRCILKLQVSYKLSEGIFLVCRKPGALTWICDRGFRPARRCAMVDLGMRLAIDA